MKGDNMSIVNVTERQRPASFWKRAIADGEELLCETRNPTARESLRLAIGWFRKRLEWSLREAKVAK
jgi:hypothetical protein